VYCYFITQERDHFPLARPRLVTLRCHEYNDWYQKSGHIPGPAGENRAWSSRSLSQGKLRAGSPARSVFVGRRRETGELGIGKTCTARELASYAENRGVQVLWGWCYEKQARPLTGPGPSPCVLTFSPRLRPTALSDGARRCRHRRNHSRSTGKTAWPEAALRPGARAAFWWWVAIEMWSYPGSTPFRRPWPGCPVSRYFSGSHSEV
jgi:hypothetical protein